MGYGVCTEMVMMCIRFWCIFFVFVFVVVVLRLVVVCRVNLCICYCEGRLTVCIIEYVIEMEKQCRMCICKLERSVLFFLML